MEDAKIISLFVSRQETAIGELSSKYGHHLRWLANNILHSNEDAKECENDTYLRTWNTIPPVIPKSLKAYVTKIVRNLSLDRYRARHAGKRSGEVDLLHSELIESIPSKDDLPVGEDEFLVKCLNDFLEGLDIETRVMFVRRYFYTESVNSLSERYGYTASSVSTKLSRVRKRLKVHLEKEGITL